MSFTDMVELKQPIIPTIKLR